jgi:hypothetical protein
LNKIAYIAAIVALCAQVYAADLPDFAIQNDVVRNIDITVSLPLELTDYASGQLIPAAAQYNNTENHNSIVRSFIEGDYNDLIASYPEYKGRIKEPIRQEEAALLYAISMYDSGVAEGRELLKNSCDVGKDFKAIACDKYTEILWADKDYDAIMALGAKLQKPYPAYTFATYILACVQRGEYITADRVLNSAPSMIMRYPNLNNLRAVVEYKNGNYDAVKSLIPYTDDYLTFITADSLINLKQYHEVDTLFSKLSEQEVLYLKAKRAIAQGRFDEAAMHMATLTDEGKILTLLNYYVYRSFPDMNRTFVEELRLTEADKKDYPIYYEALQSIVEKEYKEAIALFSKVEAPAELVTKANLYSGIALLYINPRRAEADMIDTINYSTNKSEVSSARFIMAQVYYARGQAGEAMQLLDGCQEISCLQLRGEINLGRGWFEAAIKDLEGVSTPEAHLTIAEAQFYLESYDAMRAELAKVKSSSLEVQRLKMMLAFKEGNTKEAAAILTVNKSYPPILYYGVKELMIIGDDELAMSLLKDMGELPPDMELIKANLLARSGDINQAKAVYEKLIKSDLMLYESFSGLLSLTDTEKGQLPQLLYALERLKSKDDFPQKDLLLSQMAAEAARIKENVSLLQIINLFFPTYEESQYAGNMYAARANLFYSTGRGEECLADLELALASNPVLASELRFLKNQCTEGVDPVLALEEYRSMFAEEGEYKSPAAIKLIELSDIPYEVLQAADSIKAENGRAYVRGIRKYVEIATYDDLNRDKELIEALATDPNRALKCAAIFAQARVLQGEGQKEEAAKLYYQLYKTDSKDYFVKKALESAAAIYKSLGNSTEADNMMKIRKRIK